MKNKTFYLLIFSFIVFIAIFLLIELNYMEPIDNYGEHISSFFKLASWKIIFLLITNIMSVLGITIILVLTFYFLHKKNAHKDMIIYISAITLCLLITNIIKILIKRERPLEHILEVSGFSFPSSHASISMIVYGFIILLIHKYYQGKFKNLYTFILCFFIFLTGLSRIYFNVHYITDVIAGYSLGLIILGISNIILNKKL